MAKMTKEQQSEIKLLTRRANRRLERATPGQRRALEYYIGKEKFSAASKGFTYAEAQAQIEKLNRFLAGSTSTRKGWDALKARQVSKANKEWGRMGYDLTDEELANVLIQVDTNNHQEYYRAVSLVQAAKDEAELTETDWYGSKEAVSDLLKQQIEAEDAINYAKALRKEVEANRQALSKRQKDLQERRRKVALSIGKNPRKR